MFALTRIFDVKVQTLAIAVVVALDMWVTGKCAVIHISNSL
jgi:hypothetical protein